MRAPHLNRKTSYKQLRVSRSARYLIVLITLITLRGYGVEHDNFYPHNAVACERCHNVPRKFGSSLMTVERVGSTSREAFTPVAEWVFR